MAWSYAKDPSANIKDHVRFLIGDTDSTSEQLSDEEVNHTLTESSSSVYPAAILCADSLIAKYSRLMDKNIGDLKISWSQRVEHYKGLRTTLRDRLAIRSATPYAGGISVSDKSSVKLDTDRTKPAFARGMHDNTVVSDAD